MRSHQRNRSRRQRKLSRRHRQSGASTYGPDEYAKIEGTLAALKKEESDQEGKFALFRDYGKVEQLAVTAKSDAERIKTEATKKKEEAKAAALQAQQVAQEAVDIHSRVSGKSAHGKRSRRLRIN